MGEGGEGGRGRGGGREGGGREKSDCSTLPWPGAPKSHSTDVKPMPSSCFESQCWDLELLKCWAALSE